MMVMRPRTGPLWPSVRPRIAKRITSSNIPSFVRVHEEVQDALKTGRPVVALETAIYTHGYPYPENVSLSSRLESLIRVNGAVPATIGVLDGVAHVGMEPEELIQLISTAGHDNTIKLSRRDLSYITGLGLRGKKMNGGTTIAGTMVLAHLAGIKVFATGGLGGVHRGGENSMDVSADLTELGRTPVAVVSSGCKSILDIPRTIEYLETQGVGVGTFADGRSGKVDFPGFWTRNSGVKSPVTILDEADAAAIIYAQSQLQIQTGHIFANPVPVESALEQQQIDAYINQAVREAEEQGISGNANTPFVLKRIRELSNGLSVTANTSLVEANAVRGTRVAVELAKLGHGTHAQEGGTKQVNLSISSSIKSPAATTPKVNVLVAGSIASDTICDYAPFKTSKAGPAPKLQTSNPSSISQSAGGVGRNVAAAAHLSGANVALASAVADDVAGMSLLQQMQNAGMETRYVRILPTYKGATTAQYVAVNDARKDLVLAMADMSILTRPELEQETYWTEVIRTSTPEWIVVDANWSAPIMSAIFAAARASKVPIAFEPVSTAKSITVFDRQTPSIKPRDCIPSSAIQLATPNELELAAMHTAARDRGYFDSPEWWTIVDSFGLSSAGTREKFMSVTTAELVEKGIPQQCMQLLPFMPNIVTKLGAQGCLLAQIIHEDDPRMRDPDAAQYMVSRCLDSRLPTVGGVYMRLFPPAALVSDEEMVSVNGIGDTLLGAIMAGLVKGHKLDQIVPIAQEASVLSLKSSQAVSPEVRQIAGRFG